MPRVLFQQMILGLSVYVYYKDHGFPHVAVYKGNPKSPEAMLKVVIKTWEILEVRGFNQKTVNRIINHLKNYQTELMESWNETVKK